MNEIAQFLEEEIKLNKKESWNKLDKTIKLKKLNDFAIIYCKKHNYAEDICVTLRDFLKQ